MRSAKWQTAQVVQSSVSDQEAIKTVRHCKGANIANAAPRSKNKLRDWRFKFYCQLICGALNIIEYNRIFKLGAKLLQRLHFSIIEI